MATDMFYGATAELFLRARFLRENQTLAEITLWKYISNKQLDGFRFKAQHPVHRFIADFYCHSAKLIIELDGSVHDEPEQRDYDGNRTYILEEFGIRVIRFRNQEIFSDITGVLSTIRHYLNRANQ